MSMIQTVGVHLCPSEPQRPLSAGRVVVPNCHPPHHASVHHVRGVVSSGAERFGQEHSYLDASHVGLARGALDAGVVDVRVAAAGLVGERGGRKSVGRR